MAYSSAALATTPAHPFIVVQRSAFATFDKALFDRFIDYTDRKDTTVKGYVTCIRQFVKWLDLNGITQPERENIKAYRDYR